MHVGIVGAGLAGLAAAKVLSSEGVQVTLFDKGRRPGGRANTREHGEHRLDHGAQYFTVRHPLVERWLGEWMAAGIVAPWKAKIVHVRGARVEPATRVPRYVGVPGMVAVAAHLARDLDVRPGVRIERVEPAHGRWALVDDKGAERGLFDRVVVAVPAPQAAPLLLAAPLLASAARGVQMEPCWAGMFAFDESFTTDFDAAFLRGGGLSWIARDSSKPGRHGGERWVVHATPEWTRRHWELDRNDAADRLLVELTQVVEPTTEPIFRGAHRWGFAMASDTEIDGALFDRSAGVGACGDWCHGGRVEGALLSGVDIARRIVSRGVRPRARAG